LKIFRYELDSALVIEETVKVHERDGGQLASERVIQNGCFRSNLGTGIEQFRMLYAMLK